MCHLHIICLLNFWCFWYFFYFLSFFNLFCLYCLFDLFCFLDYILNFDGAFVRMILCLERADFWFFFFGLFCDLNGIGIHSTIALIFLAYLVIFAIILFWRVCGRYIVVWKVIVWVVALWSHEDIDHLLRVTCLLVNTSKGLALQKAVLGLASEKCSINMFLAKLEDHVTVKWDWMAAALVCLIGLRFFNDEFQHFAHFFSRKTMKDQGKN